MNIPSPSSDCIWLASYDIGKVNFSFCIEEININTFESIQNIPKNKRYYKDGTCTEEFQDILNRIWVNGKIILLENIDLTYDTDKSQYIDPKLFVNMYTVLDRYKEYWNHCAAFIIEQQMSFGKKRNPMAMKLGQHCYSYFIFNYANFKQIVEFPSYHKTKVLGAGKMTKYQRKKWAVSKGIEILSERNDLDTIQKITNMKKQDDASDVVCQLQAYKYLVFVDKSI